MRKIRKSSQFLFIMFMVIVYFNINLLAMAAETKTENAAETEISNEKSLIIVGDSRTNNMSKWVTTSVPTEFVAKSGQGYSWFVKEGIDNVNKIKKPNDTIIIWLGVNDYFNNIIKQNSWTAYANKINYLASNDWADCDVYVAAVGYVDRAKHIAYFGTDKRSNVTVLKNGNKIKGIREFNQKLKASLNENITWIDTYNLIGIKNSDNQVTLDDIWATTKDGKKDGLHYSKSKTQDIYDYFVKQTSFVKKIK